MLNLLDTHIKLWHIEYSVKVKNSMKQQHETGKLENDKILLVWLHISEPFSQGISSIKSF